MKVLFAFMASLLALGSSTAAAGGWAVTTLDPVPTEFVAGDTYRVGFTIRQHGETPFVGAQSAIEVIAGNGATQRFMARPEGPNGHYVAEVRFPDAGQIQWRVDQSPFAPQPLGTVRVVGGAPVASQPGVLPALLIATLAAFGIFAWRVVVYLRSGRRLATAGVTAHLP